MVIFHSYVSLPDGILRVLFLVFLKSVGENSATTNSRRKHKFARIEAKVCGIGNLYHRHRDVQFDSLTHFWHTKNCQSQQTVLDQYWHLASGMFVVRWSIETPMGLVQGVCSAQSGASPRKIRHEKQHRDAVYGEACFMLHCTYLGRLN